MVFSWYIKQIVKKKHSISSKDKKDWIAFTDKLENVYDKEPNFIKRNFKVSYVRKLDLHGFSLDKANKVVKKFIINSFDEGFKKILIITGRGLSSKVDNNPYISKEMSLLKYSVPQFIEKDQDLFDKINKISKADFKNGGEGAFYIFLKKKKKL